MPLGLTHLALARAQFIQARCFSGIAGTVQKQYGCLIGVVRLKLKKTPDMQRDGLDMSPEPERRASCSPSVEKDFSLV